MRERIAWQLLRLAEWIESVADRIRPEPEPGPLDFRFPILTEFSPRLTILDSAESITWSSRYLTDMDDLLPTVPPGVEQDGA